MKLVSLEDFWESFPLSIMAMCRMGTKDAVITLPTPSDATAALVLDTYRRLIALEARLRDAGTNERV